MKSFINITIDFIFRVLKKRAYGKYILDRVTQLTVKSATEISYDGLSLTLAVPTRFCEWRADSFASKEPETLEWIRTIDKGSVVWDIGANIGLYSLFAAKKQNCNVFAFEPSVFNLELLAKNIFLNKLTKQITIVPLPLNDKMGSSLLRMTSTEWGGALSSFDHDLGFNGEKVDTVFEFSLIGVSMEDAKNKLGIPQPDYIKMDVDGIEHYILKGGMDVLKNVKGLLIEINDDFHEQASQCEEILTAAGLVLSEKKHGEVFENDESMFKNCYNQIWVRN
jgi:FkbM family methyltransferase